LKYRWLVLGFALFAAAALAVSVQAGRWWSIGDFEIGPFGSNSPLRGPGGLTWVGGGPRWERLGVATWAGGMIAMLVLLVVAGAAAANRVARLAAMTSLVAIVTATLAAIGFIATRPSAMPFEADRGLLLFVLGVVAGAFAAILVVRSRPRSA
jgi:hypothetical protein